MSEQSKTREIKKPAKIYLTAKALFTNDKIGAITLAKMYLNSNKEEYYTSRELLESIIDIIG